MEKTYDPRHIEQSLYQHWEKQGYFRTGNDDQKQNFCVMLPPPNVTGSLHMGHAFQQTLMDILVRYQRMDGKNTLWQAGTDHAGIATQMLVERLIDAEEGRSRHDYGREAFTERVWRWKATSGGAITRQMRRLGNSVDWQRERFTLDEGFSRAVREAFVRLWQDGLIYRGKRLVNWDPKLRTAISDLEVENRPSRGAIWHIRYPLADGAQDADGRDYLVVATTRPETLLGDSAVAVNPKDPRYQALIGQSVILPLVGRRIPVIADEHADMEKGSGCVKITPAHDFNDHQVAKRHQLAMINILTPDGNIRSHAQVFDSQGAESSVYDSAIPPRFHNMARFSARDAVVAALEESGLLEDIRPHDLMLPYGDRSGVVIEPMLTDQWFVRAAPLARPAIEAVERGDIRFVPQQYRNMYFSWMRDIQDWCISRQLWWGHRIPAWYDEQGNVYVGRDEQEARRLHHLDDSLALVQDPDVLDTWFSSSLWTFATLGWPDNSDALRRFHPTDTLVSGFDIIFFWIARMIMMTLYLVKDENGQPQAPFRTVCITGLIRDEKGQKMSKSRGNVIDPLDMVDGVTPQAMLSRHGDGLTPEQTQKVRARLNRQFPQGIAPHGADALRFTLAALASTGRDIHWDMKRLEGYRNFCNKLWNASRFVLLKTEHQACGFNGAVMAPSLAERWILAEFNRTVAAFREALDGLRFDIAASVLYEFTWSQFCDWYLEMCKPVISGDSPGACAVRHTLVTVLEGLLRLAHPIIPFITETIWQRVKALKGIRAETIMLQPFPLPTPDADDPEALSDMAWLKQVVVATRHLRAGMNIPPGQPLTLLLRPLDAVALRRARDNRDMLQSLARLESLTLLDADEKAPLAISQMTDGAELLLPVAGLVDPEAELARLAQELEKITSEITRLEGKLGNESFVTRAPQAVLERERDKLAAFLESRTRLCQQREVIAAL